MRTPRGADAPLGPFTMRAALSAAAELMEWLAEDDGRRVVAGSPQHDLLWDACYPSGALRAPTRFDGGDGRALLVDVRAYDRAAGRLAAAVVVDPGGGPCRVVY